jgi:tape measure domain-containing protein
MLENIGGLSYTVDVDTGNLIRAQQRAQRSLNEMAGAFDKFGSGLTAITRAISVYAAALAVVRSAKLADDMRLLSARVEVAAGSMREASEAMTRLQSISTKTQTSVEANAQVFQRLNQSIKQMGGNQNDTLRVTELLGMAVKVSGASAQEASSAMTQFGQALGSGKLAGDELRSLLENAPYLMQQLADGLGVPIGALKQLGEEGKLTADVVVNALSKAASKITADFEKLPATLAGAMTVATDAVARANEAMDTLSGTSATLTGVTKGVGSVFDMLAGQLLAATTESDRLGRNDTVKRWAENTTVVLSYVVDAADFVARGFRQMGTAIGGVAASVGAVARRDLKGAAEIMRSMAADVKAIGNAKFAGDKMRQMLAAMATVPAPDRLDLAAQGGGAPSKLTAPAASGKEKKKAGGAQFDALGYLASLRAKTLDEFQQIGAAEEEALRKNADLLRQRKITREQAAEAETLIEDAAARAREEIGFREAGANLEAIEKRGKEAEAERRRQQEKEERDARAHQQYLQELTRAANPIEALRQDYEARLDLVAQYESLMAQAGVDATRQAQLARTAITQEFEAQRQAMAEQTFRSQSEQNAFLLDSLNALTTTSANALVGLIEGTTSASEVMASFGRVILQEAVGALVSMGAQQLKNMLLSETMEAADKARAAANGAVYAASVGAQVASTTALAAQNAFMATAAIPLVGPALAPAAAAAAAAVAASLGAPAIATAPLAGARQYGGPTDAGSLYRINEAGAPEMFTASNGAQYLLPTQRGSVTAAGQVGGGAPTINVHNYVGAEITTSTSADGRVIDIAVRRAKAELASEVANNEGQFYGALTTSTNVRGRL